MAKKTNPVPVAWMKVYDAAGRFHASFVYPEDAAVLVAALGEGSEIRNGHAKKSVLWRDGQDGRFAAESYDAVASHIYAQLPAACAA